jgi:predicted AlkP superfamily phosphohydrolase/phosphomutase
LADCDEAKVLMIGLDAAEFTLIRRWIDEGVLPNLAKLTSDGAFGPLTSSARWLVGSPWPTFYTGTPPEEHGFYHYLIWRPHSMSTERPTPDWLPLHPFWRRFGETGPRTIAIDVPLVYPPEPFAGVELSGWGTHETMGPPAAHPPNLLDRVRREFGTSPFGLEASHLLSAAQLLEVRDQWLRTTALAAELGEAQMARESWDFFLICFAAPHRCGHQLWNLTGMKDGADPAEAAAVAGALKEVYIGCDAAVGRLVARAGPETVTLVFAVHGMGSNLSRTDLLREMLGRVLAGDSGSPDAASRWAQRARAAVPLPWRSWVKSHLPQAVQDRLTLFWRSGGIDWRTTNAFAVFGDLEGYIRLNLRGREAAGIVEPGDEAAALRQRIEDGLRTFVDADSGEPLVHEIARAEMIFADGPMRSHLPDLIVFWSNRPASEHRRIVSPRHGSIDWPTPGHHPQGRSGNHRPTGFLIAAGGPVPPGASIEGHVLDLAPTVHALLGQPVPPEMHGRALF